MRFILYITLFISIATAYAQQDSLNTRSRKSAHLVGFDANNLLKQVIPFNNVQSTLVSPAIIARRLWGNQGYRFAAGADLNDASNNLFLYLSFGYTRKDELGKNFSFIKGIDVRLQADDFNTEFLGIAPYWGVEYNFNEIISVSTETSLEVGAGVFGDFRLSVKPPVHIQCHFYLNRNK